MAPAAIVVFIGGYVESLDIFGITRGWPVYLAFYAIFVGVHLLGVGEALKVIFVITAIAVVALVVFVVAMIPEFGTSNLTDIARTPARPARRTSCRSAGGHLGRVPVRDLVLPGRRGRPARRRGDARPEEGHAARADRRHAHPARLRRADAHAHARAAAAPTRSRTPTTRCRWRSTRPRATAAASASFVNYVGLAGLIASFFSIIFAYSRQLFALSRAGYLPRALSVTSSRKVPVRRADRPGVDRLPARGDHRGRRHDAQHRGLRRDGLLRADDARPHRAAPARARPRAAATGRRAAPPPRASRSCSRCSPWWRRSWSTRRRR